MEIIKDIEIDVGHRIMQHESKCRHVHGHRLRFCIHATALKLDSVGRIVDFGVIKGVLGKWLNDNLDHVFVANPKDPVIEFLKSQGLRYFIMRYPATIEAYKNLKDTSPRPAGSNWFQYIDEMYKADMENLEPTSENIARMVFEQFLLLTQSEKSLAGIEITQLEVFETPSSSATFNQEDLHQIWGRYIKPDQGATVPWWHGFLPYPKDAGK
jgi:6-pyruvoyl-tetrahydropterin synthase